MAQLALLLFLVAAATGAFINLNFHWKMLPLPTWLVQVHAGTAVCGFLLLVIATWTVSYGRCHTHDPPEAPAGSSRLGTTGRYRCRQQRIRAGKARITIVRYRTDICSGKDDDQFLGWQDNCAIRSLKGVNMIRITDKSFRYTTSFNTDLKKKFRKIEQERRAAAASSTVSEAPMVNSVVPMIGRRSVPRV